MGNYATKFLFVLTVTLSISCASSHKIDENALALSDKKASAETVELYLKLQENLERGTMLGHQDALAYGNNWFLDEGRSDVKSVCGDYPAVFGWDIGDIEKGNLANCDSIPFTTLANYVRKVEQWGGISVFTWHASNPVTGKTASDCSTQNAVKQVIENDSVQKKFLASLDKVAQFLGNLKDEAGKPIPVIFQPFHGHDSDSALWWSTTQCSASDFKNLWKLTVNYLQNEKGVHNLLYAYSVYSNDPADILPAYYPGNDFVDIIGINSHLLQGDGCSGREFIQELNEGIASVTQFAAKNKKIAAVTSTGLEGIKISDFFSKYLYPVISQYKLSFVLFEKNAWNQEKHYFIPVPGHPASEDFIRFVSYPDILTCDDIKK